MTKSKQPDRAQAISCEVRNYAYDEGKSYLTSFWDLAYSLNNGWYAPLFLPDNYEHKSHDNGRGWWAAPTWDLNKFRKQLHRAVRKMGGQIIKQGYNDFYRFPKKIIVDSS